MKLAHVVGSLVLLAGAAAAPAAMKQGTFATQGPDGWCCVDCAAKPLTEYACDKEEGEFFPLKPDAEKACAARKGWCCVGGQLVQATRAQCGGRKGEFFCDKKDAVKQCIPPKEEEASKKLLSSPPPAATKISPPPVAVEAPSFPREMPLPGTSPGWCYLAGGLLQLTKEQCEKRGGVLFEQREDALAYGRSGGAKGEPDGAQPAPGGFPALGTRKTLEKPEPGMKAFPAGEDGARVLRADTPPQPGTPGAMVPGSSAARVSRSGARASSLAQRIRISSPLAGSVFDWGDTVRVRYRVLLPDESPGDVTFTLRDPEYRTVATMTHFYDAPVFEEGSEIEIVGEAAPGDGFYSLGGGAGGADDGPGVFDWVLPAGGGGIGGSGFTIAARKGPHRGVSGGFTMLPGCAGRDMSVRIEPPQTVLRRGQAVTIVFAFCGWGGLSTRDQPIYIHDVTADAMGLWSEPRFTVTAISDDRVRGTIRAWVPADYHLDGTHEFTLFYGDVGTTLSTPHFEVAEAVGWDDIELADLFRNGTGDIVALAWVGSSFDGTTLTLQVNDRILSHVVKGGANQIVVGSLPILGGATGLGPESDCAEEWDVRLDPGGVISESDESNNRLTRVFSRYQSSGVVWLGDAAGSYGATKHVGCDCPDISPMSPCETDVHLRNCSSEPVENLDDLVTVVQSGVRQRSGGLGTESFSESVPFTLYIGSSRLLESTLPVGELAVIRIPYGNYRAYDDSTLTYSFSGPLAAWAGIQNPFVVNLNFGSWDFTSGSCVY